MLPDDFSTFTYKYLNPDLRTMTDSELIHHYLYHGRKENRVYNITLPPKFDVLMYKEFNPDLKNISNVEAKKHFIMHGKKENRRYNDPHFDRLYFSQKYKLDPEDPNLYNEYAKDIRQDKNNYFESEIDTIFKDKGLKHCILMVNHDHKMFGASLCLLQNYKILCENFKQFDIIMVHDQEPINQNELDENQLYTYHNDPTYLYKIYIKLKPILIYVNSVNYAISRFINFIPKEKLLLHSHESKINYHYFMDQSIIPDFVVSNRIANEYKIPPKILTPLLLNYKEILEKSMIPLSDKKSIVNHYGKINLDKITICMCGQVCERKNYNLFLKIAEKFPEYNFIWIGNQELSLVKNIYHIGYTNNPYQYFKQIIDIFILFSKEDPCPMVVIENILLETPILTFAPNILYNHCDELIKKFYFEYPLEINLKNCEEAIKSLHLQKRDFNKLPTNNGLQYILSHFYEQNILVETIIQRLNNQYD